MGGHILRTLTYWGRSRESFHEISRRDDEPSLAGRRHVIDLADLAALRACVLSVKPTHILHTAAVTAVADAEKNPPRARRVNIDATRTLCEAADQVGARFLHCSTDLVFDGKQSPYDEESARTPTTEYGRTKAEAEDVVLTWPRTLIVRLPLMFGFAVTRKATTFATQIQSLVKGEPLKLFTDEFRGPIWLADAARALLTLARSPLTGLIHVAGPARLSRYELISQCADVLKIPNPNLVATLRASVPGGDQRPADVVLLDQRFRAQFPDFQRTPVNDVIFDHRFGGPSKT